MAQNIFRKHKESNRVTNHPLWDINISNVEQISLEEKVNNILKWLANQIACLHSHSSAA